MDRRGLAVFRNSFLVLVAACVSVQSACQYPAATPPAPAAVSPMPAADSAPAIPGSRFCGEWLVRLTSTGGQLSGTLSHARNTAIPIQNLELMPDGSFSGTTPASMSGSRRAPPSKVTGQFSRDTVSLTFDSELCPPRQGTATRRALGG